MAKIVHALATEAEQFVFPMIVPLCGCGTAGSTIQIPSRQYFCKVFWKLCCNILAQLIHRLARLPYMNTMSVICRALPQLRFKFAWHPIDSTTEMYI